MSRTFHEAFFKLTFGLDGYIDEISPYQVDGSQTVFPKLPTELRINIYDNLLPEQRSLSASKLMSILHPLESCGLFHFNESTRIEISLHLINTRLLEIDSDACRSTFINFLEKLPGEQGFWSVRRLRFNYFTEQIPVPGGAMNDNMDFINRCKNLRCLTLELDAWKLMRSWDLNGAIYKNYSLALRACLGDYNLLDVEEIVQRYQLYRILNLSELDKLLLNWDYKAVLQDGDRLGVAPLIDEIASWARREFEKRGRKVLAQAWNERERMAIGMAASI